MKFNVSGGAGPPVYAENAIWGSQKEYNTNTNTNGLQYTKKNIKQNDKYFVVVDLYAISRFTSCSTNRLIK